MIEEKKIVNFLKDSPNLREWGSYTLVDMGRRPNSRRGPTPFGNRGLQTKGNGERNQSRSLTIYFLGN